MIDSAKKTSPLQALFWIVLAGLLLRIGMGPLGPGLLIAMIPICILGLLASVAVCGPSGALAGAKFLIGRAKESELPVATRALGAAGRFLIHLGFSCGVVALLSNLDMIRLAWVATKSSTPAPRVNPADLAWVFRYGIILGIPATLFAGRFVLGAAAELAALRSGRKPPRYSIGVQVCAMLLVPIQLSLFLVSFNTIVD